MQKERRQEIIRMTIGILVAILLHLLILLIFIISNKKISMPPAKSGKKISLDLSHFVPPPTPAPKPIIPPPTPKPKPKPIIKKTKEIVKPIPQPKQKIIDKDKILTAKRDISENNITKEVKKIEEKKVVKPKQKKKIEKKIKKKVVKKSPPKKSPKVVQKRRKPTKTPPKRVNKVQNNSPLANSLMGSSRARSIQTNSSRSSHRKVSAATRNVIKKLYGSEFDGFGEAQKKFIENNLAMIHHITQSTLNRNGYPEVAARTGQQGVNIVSFYLHPNGNISNLRLEVGMGYEILDENTLHVIRLAYKDYPLPLKKTKIKFYVEYTIEGY